MALFLGALGAVVSLGGAASAIPPPSPKGFELQTLDPALPGDTFVLAPNGSVEADGALYARLLAADAYKPLLRRSIAGGTADVVSSQFLLNGGVAYAIRRRFLFALNLPVVPYQGGGDASSPSSAGLGDLRLSMRGALVQSAPATLGVEGRLWFPTGNENALTGDGAIRASLHLAVNGRVSGLRYAASVGYLGRERRVVRTVEIGPAIPFALGAAWAFDSDRAMVGLELQGQTVVGGGTSLFADRTTPMVGLLTGRTRFGSIVMGLGVGPGLTHAPGAAPHVALFVGWEPEPEPEQRAHPEPSVPDPFEKLPLATPKRPPPPPPPPPPPEPAVETAAPPPPPPPEEPPKDDAATRAEAKRLFQDGVVAYDEKRFKDARAAFGKAYAMKPHPIVLLNLAQSELMDGELSQACTHFEQWKKDEKNPAPAVLEQAEQGIRQACH